MSAYFMVGMTVAAFRTVASASRHRLVIVFSCVKNCNVEREKVCVCVCVSAFHEKDGGNLLYKDRDSWVNNNNNNNNEREINQSMRKGV